jgi:hypothetical protein
MGFQERRSLLRNFDRALDARFHLSRQSGKHKSTHEDLLQEE